MKIKKSSLRTFINIVKITFLVLSFAAIIKSCFVSIDIDESYAIAQSYRMAIGDHMFSQMWEPHQMSAFGAALFIKPFLLLTQGSTTGIVLYLRIVGTFIHLLLGLWLYKIARRRTNLDAAFFIYMAHTIFLPKWVSIPEFELMQYWFVLILFLSLLTWMENIPKRTEAALIVGGVALFGCMMTYPTMILLYPVYAAGICVLQKGEKKGRLRFRSIVFFTLPLLILGILFLIYLRTYMTIPEFVENVGYIFMDKSHTTQTLSTKMADYLVEIGRLLLHMLWYFPIVLTATGLLFWRKKRAMKKNRMNLLEGESRNYWIKWCTIVFLLFMTIAFEIDQISMCVFGDKSQFYLFYRYGFVAFVGLLGCIMSWKENKEYFWFGFVPGLVGVIASALITNMTLEISMARFYISVIAAFMVMIKIMEKKLKKERAVEILSILAAITWIVGLLVCRLWLIRVTGCNHLSMMAKKELVTCGPAKGLWIEDELAWIYNENNIVIMDNISKEDTLLYFGCENLYYLTAAAKPATPSMQGTAVFDEMFIKYYEEHPDRIPNVVIIDKTYPENSLYRYSYDNHVMEEWIAKNFADADVMDTAYLKILRK